jgi:S1-C subfamily serine protease
VNKNVVRYVFAASLLLVGYAPPGFADSPASTPIAVAASPTGAAKDPKDSVVKVFATVRRPDPARPWTKQAPAEVTGSGAVIDGNRILTNAHVVQYASQVQIQANRAGDKLLATVVAVAPGIDLAVLTVDDPTFFAEHAPLARASSLPDIKEAVLAYGFPTGGTALSITKGIVSRIEFMEYNSLVSGLRIQIDAAINPGNSGGPVMVDDKMIGLAFGTLGNNIGYIIPNEEIELFLEDIADGHYDGKPAMHDVLQTLENADLRRFLALEKSVHGIVVHRPYRKDAAYPLKEWDVITAIGTTPVDDQGMITVGSQLRLHFQYLVQKLAKNGTVPLTVVRAGKTLSVALPVGNRRPFMVPDLGGAYPEYFIYGPLVFSRGTLEHLQILGNSAPARGLGAMISALQSPLIRQVGLAPTPERDELVVVSSPFFPHKITAGYDNPAGAVLARVNGKPVRSLRQLVGLLRDLTDEFVTFEFEQTDRETLVFSRTQVVAATESILADNDVRAQGSPELLDVWRGRAGK